MSGASSRQIHGTLQVDGHAVRPSRDIAVSGDLASVVGADVVRDDGTFEIKDVPAGKHQIVAWHPFAGKVEMEVEVPEGGKADVKAEVKK